MFLPNDRREALRDGGRGPHREKAQGMLMWRWIGGACGDNTKPTEKTLQNTSHCPTVPPIVFCTANLGDITHFECRARGRLSQSTNTHSLTHTHTHWQSDSYSTRMLCFFIYRLWATVTEIHLNSVWISCADQTRWGALCEHCLSTAVNNVQKTQGTDVPAGNVHKQA